MALNKGEYISLPVAQTASPVVSVPASVSSRPASLVEFESSNSSLSSRISSSMSSASPLVAGGGNASMITEPTYSDRDVFGVPLPAPSAGSRPSVPSSVAPVPSRIPVSSEPTGLQGALSAPSRIQQSREFWVVDNKERFLAAYYTVLDQKESEDNYAVRPWIDSNFLRLPITQLLSVVDTLADKGRVRLFKTGDSFLQRADDLALIVALEYGLDYVDRVSLTSEPRFVPVARLDEMYDNGRGPADASKLFFDLIENQESVSKLIPRQYSTAPGRSNIDLHIDNSPFTYSNVMADNVNFVVVVATENADSQIRAMGTEQDEASLNTPEFEFFYRLVYNPPAESRGFFGLLGSSQPDPIYILIWRRKM